MLVLFAAAYALTLMLSFIVGRYRMPLVPVLLLFAGFGGVTVWDAWRARERKTIAVFLVALVATAALSYPRWTQDKFDTAWSRLGNAYAASQRDDEAVDAFRKALEINPKLITAWIGLARALERQGQIEPALDAYRRGAAANPDQAAPHFFMGLALIGQERYDEAAQAFERGLRIDPTNRRAREWLEAYRQVRGY